MLRFQIKKNLFWVVILFLGLGPLQNSASWGMEQGNTQDGKGFTPVDNNKNKNAKKKLFPTQAMENNRALGVSKEQKKAKPKEHYFTRIPDQVPCKNGKPMHTVSDDVWHQAMKKLIDDSYGVLRDQLIEQPPPHVKTPHVPPTAHNVATFQIRTIWSDGTEKKMSFADILFLSKMSLATLSRKFNMKKGDGKQLAATLQQKGLDDSVHRLMCFGDFFEKGTGTTQEYAARKFVADLFGFTELDGVGQRERHARAFESKFIQALQENSKKCPPEIVKIARDLHKDSLFGLFGFDEKSNSKAKKHFNGVGATDAFAAFDKNFADSEQAIYQFLLRLTSKDIQKNLAPEDIQKNVSLENIVVDIISYRPMCAFCKGTGERYVKNNKILNVIAKGLERQMDGPTLSFWISYVQDISEDNTNDKKKEK